MKAVLNQTRVTQKKAQLMAELVRGKSVTEALAILKLTPKKAAKTLFKVITSAAKNAENNFSQKTDDLLLKSIHVGKGIMYKRFKPANRGRANPILKRTCNITVEVMSKAPAPMKKTESAAKVTVKEPAKKEAKKVVKKEAKPKSKK